MAGDPAKSASTELVAPSPAPGPVPGEESEAHAPSGTTQDNLPAMPADTYTGYLESVRQGAVVGWAFNRAVPTQRVRIEIWADSKFLGVGTADVFRADLEDAEIGDGRHGFQIGLPPDLEPGEEYQLAARVSGEDFELLGSPLIFTAPKSGLTGRIDRLEGAAVHCVITSDRPGTFQAGLFLDDTSLGGPSLDAQAAGETIGFAVGIPNALLDGQAHWFRLSETGSGTVLAEAVLVTPCVMTPDAVLRQYTRQFPGFLSPFAALRYESLRCRLNLLAADPSVPAALRQLGPVLESVMMGFDRTDTARPPLSFPVVDDPDVSIIVPVHDKFEITYNCLAALLLAPNKASFEVIVVDDASADQTTGLASLVSGITVIRNETSLGFVHSSNRGAEAARGRYVVMLNNDTEPCARWLDELLHVFATWPDAGLVGSKLLYPDGRLQEGGALLFRGQCWAYGRGDNPHDPRYSYTRETDYISGAAIMLPRALWEQLHGFDALFAPAYYEDTDLAMRVRAAGKRVIYAPFSQVIHYEGQSNGTSLDAGVKRHQVLNEPKFRARWAVQLQAQPTAATPDLAKDRGILFRVLAIDAETPRPDTFAGGYAAVQEIRLLQSLGAKVTFVPENLTYLGNYTEALQRMGVECLHAPYVRSIRELIATRGAEFDVFYITRYRVAEPLVDAIRQAAPHARIMLCNADLHFLRELRAALVTQSAEDMAAAVRTRDAELALMRKVDVTLTYTEAEAAVIQSHNLGVGGVARCPWVVDVSGSRRDFDARTDIAFLGGFGHPPNLDATLHFITEVMPLLRERLPGVKFRIHGAGIPDSLRELARKEPTQDVVIGGYVADVAEVYDTCRVFVAPLRSGAGIKGKVIGALAAGVPIVLSPVAAEGTGIAHGQQAMIAETPAEWADAICLLYGDKERWDAMSRNAAELAAGRFSFAVGRRLMRAALTSVGIHTPDT